MFHDSKLYEETYDEAIRNNAKVIAEIEEFKKELEDVKQSLDENQKHLFQNIMAPLAGGKALIKAKLVRTNDIVVFLGDKWFVRTSATRAIDICNRKIQRCNENLAEIERETNRFSSNIEKSQEFDIFSNDDNLPEIVEPYDEEAEIMWREKHREKVREFKKQEAAERNRERAEDYFEKLNKLEEESDEFKSNVCSDKSDSDSSDENRASPTITDEDEVIISNSDILIESQRFVSPSNENDSSIKNAGTTFQLSQPPNLSNSFHVSIENQDSASVPKEDNNTVTENANAIIQSSDLYKLPRSSVNTCVENVNTIDQSSKSPSVPHDSYLDGNTSPERHSTSKKRVSFSSTDELKCYSPSESVNTVDTNIIRFKHSDIIASHLLGENDQIYSPSDIHRLFTRDFNPKSILRKEPQLFQDAEMKYTGSSKKWETRCENRGYEPKENREYVFGDILEKNPDDLLTFEKTSRQRSKFQKSRSKF